MEPTSSHGIPQDLSVWIDAYNQTPPGEKKREFLNKIHDIVSQFLEENKSSADVQAIKKELKAVRWYEDDLAIRSQILGEIDAHLPAAATAAPQLIGDIYALIANEADKQTVASLLRFNKKLKESLTQPKALADFLTRFSSELSPQTRFALALRCGPALTQLDLSKFYKFNDAMLQQLTQTCPNLQVLNLSKTSIQTLNYLPKGLKELNLTFCNSLKPEAFEKLTADAFPHLEKLILQETSIMQIEHLYLCKSLKELNVQETRISRIDYFPKYLKELNLGKCLNLPSAELVEKLTVDSFPELEKLWLMKSLISSLDHLPKNLKVLDLSLCTDLPPEAFEQLTQEAFPNLEELYVGGTTIKRIDHLPKSLKVLDISNCSNLKGESFEKLTADSFPKLEKLNLRMASANKNLLPEHLQAVVVEEVSNSCTIM